MIVTSDVRVKDICSDLPHFNRGKIYRKKSTATRALIADQRKEVRLRKKYPSRPRYSGDRIIRWPPNCGRK